MGATYTRQSSSGIVDGGVIEASDINNEFDQLLAAFAVSTGHTHDGTTAEGGPVTKLLGNTLTFGAGTAGTDITMTFDGETSDGILYWMEDEDYFKFADDILVNSTEKLMFQDTGTYIYSNADGDLDLVSDGTAVDSINLESAGGITLDAGTAGSGVVYEDDGTEMARLYNSSSDVILETKVSDKDFSIKGNDGGSAITALSLDMSAAGAATFNDKVIATELDISGDMDIDGTSNLDNTDIDGTLAVDGTTISLDATTSLNIDNSNTSNGITIGTATSGVPISIGHSTSEVTVNDNLTVTGTLTLGSGAELTEAELEMLDGITAGTVAASKAVVVDANKDAASFRNITLTGELDAATLDISGNADIDGTTNLDAVDIDGAVQLDATLTIGADDQGYDVIFYGDTASANLTWDTSVDDLILNGAARIVIPDGQLVLGSTAVSSTAAELNILDGKSFVDEDNMSSDSATAIASQQSIKAYVDAQKADMQFILEDDDGTEVSINKDNEVKIIGSGVTTKWTDTDNGTDGDPYDLTITVDAAQTGITSLLATDIKIGEDDQTKIDFETADEIHFYANNTEQVYVGDNIFGPQSDSDVDLGTTGARWKDAFVDSITVTGEVDGASLDISGNADIDGTLEADAITVDGTALATYIRDTVGTNMLSSNTESGISVTYDTTNDNIDFAISAAQTTITSILATDVKIGEDDQTKIDFETADTIHFYAGNENQLILTDGALTPASNAIVDLGTDALEFKDAYFDGTVETDALSIAGTAITTTAAEINLIDGGTSRGTTAVASGDGILINDGGTMRMTNVDTVSTYFASHSVGGGNIVTTGALDSGSITSGFGTIDTGSSTITTTGLITGGSLDIDDVVVNGTTIGHTDDTDLMTVADGLLTVAGEISVTTLDIGGTNVSATAAEINYSDLATLGTSAASKVLSANANNLTTISGAVLFTEDTLTDGSTVSWDVIASPVAKVTLAGNRTLAAPSGTSPAAGQFISLLIIQDGTGSRTLTWNATYEFKEDTAPTLTTTASKGDLFVFRYNGSKWLEVGRNQALTLS